MFLEKSFRSLMFIVLVFFFFFSSRRRHTRWNCDWSSDVCSSDLSSIIFLDALADLKDKNLDRFELYHFLDQEEQEIDLFNRSEERRVGKECRSRWSPYD